MRWLSIGWKDWPYWLKGIVVVIILLILLMLFEFVSSCDFGRHQEFCGLITIFSIPIFVVGYIMFLIIGRIGWNKIFEHIKISKSSLYGGLILVGIMLILSFMPGVNTTLYGPNPDYSSLIYVLPLAFVIGVFIGGIVGKIRKE